MGRVLLVGIFLVLTEVAAALEVAGVDVADEVTLGEGQTLVLNGAGVRKKVFVKVYVGALYLPEPAAKAERAIEQPGAKRVLMHFVYDGVEKSKITEAWDKGFRSNLTEAAFASLEPRLQVFNNMFEDMKKGERIELDYLPGKGMRVSIKGSVKGTVEGVDFMRALLSVWLGEQPADRGLKRAMLGAR